MSPVEGAAPVEELEAIFSDLGLVSGPTQVQALLDYVDLLQRWNVTYNLTAVRDRAGILSQHLADCLAVLPHLLAHIGAGRVLDVGSGGGLPGVVLSIMQPALDVTCVDTVGKKAAFIRQVGASLGLPNLHAEHARVEQLKVAPFPLITARAFASLKLLVELTEPLLAPGGVWMAMKGQTPHEEMSELPESIEVFHVEQLQVPTLQAQRCLVWMRRRQRATLDGQP